jgi:hypothetical protein
MLKVHQSRTRNSVRCKRLQSYAGPFVQDTMFFNLISIKLSIVFGQTSLTQQGLEHRFTWKHIEEGSPRIRTRSWSIRADEHHAGDD